MLLDITDLLSVNADNIWLVMRVGKFNRRKNIPAGLFFHAKKCRIFVSYLTVTGTAARPETNPNSTKAFLSSGIS